MEHIKKGCFLAIDELKRLNKSLPTGIFDLVRFGKKCRNANFLDEELIAIINSAQLNNSITEKDAKNTPTELHGKPKEVKPSKE
ncbi:hypothetical protein OUZ56_011476 [Daphnia magna]|uniref:Uncharacterized protein n=1 Tax=Daphnia magna TaxID=35525 RepID=A0ABQ9Z094_9CRUS|nr:hypothetical protein OUZ56_011476 [Daphnia magna]